MGKVVWSLWGHLIALTAAFFEVCGGILGIFYRMATFDTATSMFNFLVDPINFLAIATIVFGVICFAIEYPLPFLSESVLVKQLWPKVVLYISFGAISALNYQNVNPGLYLIIAGFMYLLGIISGEGRSRSTGNAGKV